MNKSAKFYDSRFDGGRLDAARLKLCLFDRDTVAAIVDLVGLRGRSLVDDVFERSTPMDPPHLFAIVGPEFVQHDDVPELLLGLSTLLLASLRAPRLGLNDYANLLHQAYDIPTPYALVLAKKIESYDTIMSDANQDGDTTLYESLKKYVNVVEEGVRRIVNTISTDLGLESFIQLDSEQDYDVDMLYEIASLGNIVADLNQRSRLMIGQGLIAQSLGTFGTGDPTVDDQTRADLEIGDVLGIVGRKPLHPGILGNLNRLSQIGRRSAYVAGRNIVRRSKLAKKQLMGDIEDTKLTDHGADNHSRRSLLDIIKGSTPLTALLGAVLGAGGNLIRHAIGGKDTGDPSIKHEFESQYGDIADEFGDPVAKAWVGGDIEGVVKAAMLDADQYDPALLTDYELEAADSMRGLYGDPSEEGLSPEIGGLFTKWRRRRAIKKAHKVKARLNRKSRNLAMKQKRKDELAAYRNQARQEAVDPDKYYTPSNEIEYPDPAEAYVDESSFGADYPSNESEYDQAFDNWDSFGDVTDDTPSDAGDPVDGGESDG